jgi:large subunit ribosomal protein L9
MRVFLLKDVEKVGMAGEVIKTTEGFARNYLIPKKLGVEVTSHNEASLVNRIKVVEHRKEVVASKTSMLAERIKSLELVLKRKVHDGGKLYGAVSATEVVDLLADKGIGVSKSQVIFDKTIKSKGKYQVVIKLSSQLQPAVLLNVVGLEQQA